MPGPLGPGSSAARAAGGMPDSPTARASSVTATRRATRPSRPTAPRANIAARAARASAAIVPHAGREAEPPDRPGPDHEPPPVVPPAALLDMAPRQPEASLDGVKLAAVMVATTPSWPTIEVVHRVLFAAVTVRCSPGPSHRVAVPPASVSVTTSRDGP